VAKVKVNFPGVNFHSPLILSSGISARIWFLVGKLQVGPGFGKVLQ
jgi:hypothetical protein